MKVSYEKAWAQIKDKTLRDMHVLVGFDAVVDHLVQLVKHRDEKGVETLFSTVEEFGAYLCSKKGMSCCLELKTITSKIGGNMAILAQALAKQGANVSCIGTLGEENSFLHQTLAEDCEVYSIAPSGSCTALEFQDGKVMLADIKAMQICWQDVLNHLGAERLADLLRRSEILCLVNWSELIHASEVWRELLQFAIARQIAGDKTVFFDLADCSLRSVADIRECVSIMADYSRHFKTVLGLNRNEAQILSKTYGIETEAITEMGPALQQVIQVGALIIHSKHGAHVFDADGNVYEGMSFVCENPLTLTGCGDNFNAGYCLGILLGLESEGCLLLANAASGYYVRTGQSASFDCLKTFIEDRLDKKVDRE